jgi:hypothetical protein
MFGYMYLICVDAHSKWMEIFHMNSATADATINKLQELFSQGLPETTVSDNGPQFISDSFKQFCVRNGIVHSLSAPYDPSSNELAERAVQSFKRALKATMKDNPNLPISQAICNWQMAYRNTTHSYTGRPPAELMIGRSLRTRLTILKQSFVNVSEQKNNKPSVSCQQIYPKDPVLARNYSTNDTKWVKAQIIKPIGLKIYLICTNSNEYWVRNTRQLLHREEGEIRGKGVSALIQS